MNGLSFSEFNPVSAKQWKQKIQVDLKGADYNKTLVWESNDGIKVKPFYHKDDFEQLPIKPLKNEFSVCQSIFISDEKIANFLAKDALKRGATSILFEANVPFDIKVVIDSLFETSSTNEGQPKNHNQRSLSKKTQLHFKLNFLSEDFLSDLIEKTNHYNISLNIDLIGNLAKTGNWFYNAQKDHTILEHIVYKSTQNATVISVDIALYQNAGATVIQQVAYALAHANEYLNHFNNIIAKDSITEIENKIRQQAFDKIQFHFSVGSNYFFEIAKLRAFRYLWDLLCNEYNFSHKASIIPHIFITPSLRNKTLYDYNVNMLRTTTECMSAILGGANTISNLAYDAIYHKKNEFGERIARNQLLILQNESYLREAAGIADGSYYVETITKQIAEKALTIFKDIEKAGGFFKQLQEGIIQRKIDESAKKEQVLFNSGEEVLIGTNKYPNNKDRMKDDIELYPFVKAKPRKTLIAPIIPKRLSENLEQARLEEER